MLTVIEQGLLVEYIQANLQGDVSLPTLATLVGLNMRTFTKLFKQSFAGWTAHQYILNARVVRAERLLTDFSSKLSLEQVALLCGFCSQSHLGWAFKRSKGTTPAKYRAAHIIREYQKRYTRK